MILRPRTASKPLSLVAPITSVITDAYPWETYSTSVNVAAGATVVVSFGAYSMVPTQAIVYDNVVGNYTILTGNTGGALTNGVILAVYWNHPGGTVNIYGKFATGASSFSASLQIVQLVGVELEKVNTWGVSYAAPSTVLQLANSIIDYGNTGIAVLGFSGYGSGTAPAKHGFEDYAATSSLGIHHAAITIAHAFNGIGHGGLRTNAAQGYYAQAMFKAIPRRIFVPVSASGNVTLYPSLYTNDQAFYAHTASQSGGTQTLTPGFYTSAQDFYAHTLSASKTLAASLYTNDATFYGPTVTRGTVTLTPALYTNDATFYGPTVTRGTVTITPALYTNDATFYAHVLNQAGGPQNLAPTLYANSNTFYSHTLAPGAVTVTPSLYNNDQTFYSLTLTTSKMLAATRFDNDQTFFSPVVSQDGGPQYVAPNLFDNTQSYFTHTVSVGQVQLYPVLLDNAQSFYSHSVSNGTPPTGLTLTAEDIQAIAAAVWAHASRVLTQDVAGQVLAALNATTIPVDMQKTNGVEIIGDGTEGNKFRSVLVP